VRFQKPNCLNQKKGISSIVGGIFFLVLMTSGFTVYYVALDSQSQMLDTQQIIADSEVAKIKEKFVVAASSSGVNNVLSVQVINTGNNLVEIADIWIINKTSVFENATKYNDLDYRDVSIPVGYSGNVLKNHTPLNLISDIYDIKVVSSLGTIQTVEYDVAGGSNVLNAQMVAIPNDVRFGENVTIALIVTNTGEFDITQVEANTEFDVIPNQCSATPNMIFGGPVNLSPAQSTMFFWDCVLEQPTGNTITFTGNATGELSGVDVDSNDASDSVVVRDFGIGEEIVLNDDLFGKPGIFMVIPSPYGYSPTGQKGLWGVNIANPTDGDMVVNKVVLSLILSRYNDDPDIFKPGSCSPDDIEPPTAAWKCDEANQLKWEPSVGSQHTIPAKSVQQFLVLNDDNEIVQDTEYDTILVTASVFTSLGHFSKTGYATSYQHDGTNVFEMVNVYLTRDKDDPLNKDNMHTTQLGMEGGVPMTFNATLVDFETTSSKFIQESISKLIINIPSGWTLDSYSSAVSGSYTHFTIPPPVVHPDGSSQITGTLNYKIDGEGILADRIKAGVIQFTVTPPVVLDNKMYVMHILADGYTEADWLIGPIAETVFQVCPGGVCS